MFGTPARFEDISQLRCSSPQLHEEAKQSSKKETWKTPMQLFQYYHHQHHHHHHHHPNCHYRLAKSHVLCNVSYGFHHETQSTAGGLMLPSCGPETIGFTLTFQSRHGLLNVGGQVIVRKNSPRNVHIIGG